MLPFEGIIYTLRAFLTAEAAAQTHAQKPAL